MRHLNARKAFSLCTHFTAIITIVLFFVSSSRAGGPDYVAGANYFQTNAMGQPLTWSQGQIDYYTDQGDLSPILPNAAANALVADAFSYRPDRKRPHRCPPPRFRQPRLAS